MKAVQDFISITPWTMVFQICNLLILFCLIKKFLFKPVMAILAARQAEIDDLYDAADKDRDAAAQMKAEYAQRMSTARDEADQLMRNAIDTAQKRGDKIVNEAKEQAEHLTQKVTAEIEMERQKAFSELKGEISGMAVDIAERMVKREIDEKDHMALVEDFIRNAGEAS